MKRIVKFLNEKIIIFTFLCALMFCGGISSAQETYTLHTSSNSVQTITMKSGDTIPQNMKSASSTACGFITHSNSQDIISGISTTCVPCPLLSHYYYRDFDLVNDFAITNDFEVNSVEFGVAQVSSPVTLNANIYSSIGAFPGGTLTLLGTGTYNASTTDTNSIISIPLTATVPAGSIMVYEIEVVGSTGNIQAAINFQGQTGTSWQSLELLPIIPIPPDPSLGDSVLVMNVLGNVLSSGSTVAFQEIFSNSGVALGDVAFADVDGDSDQDLFITGSRGIQPSGNASGAQVSYLFENNGSGVFNFVPSLPFVGKSHASSVLRDFNNDSHLDYMTSGEDFTTGINTVNIYTGDGAGNFSSSGLSAPISLKRRDFVYANLDSDPDEEILVIGVNNGGVARTGIYDWQGSFYSRAAIPTLPRVKSGSLDVADVDADGDMDVFISGSLTNGTLISGLYLNDGSAQFSQCLTTNFTAVSHGDSKFSDVDNDGDMDLIMSGRDNSMNNVMKLYLNNGCGGFIEEMNVFPSSNNILFDGFNLADINGDSDMDLVLTGYNTNTYQTVWKIWTNLLFLPRPGSPLTTDSNTPRIVESEMKTFGDNFSLYPNPTKNGLFSIKTPNLEGETVLSISNVMGNEIIRKDVNISRQEIQIEAQSLKRGMYIVKLSQGLNTYTARLMVE